MQGMFQPSRGDLHEVRLFRGGQGIAERREMSS